MLLGSVSSLIGYVAAFPTRFSKVDGHVEVHAHRGGMGMRSEASLWAFAYAMEIGVDTLEMDVLFTADRVPVVWHDHSITSEKCRGDYVGQFVANLTLAQLKTLDCSVPLVDFPSQQLHPETRIPTLTEVLDLIICYNDPQVTISLETKLDPLTPNETLTADTYITDIIPILESYNFLHRTSIQSFDWRTLVGIHAQHPAVQIVALIDELTTAPDMRAPHLLYPWLGGVNFSLFNGDWVAAAASIGASIVSPVHGVPAEGGVHTPGYEPFVTKRHVARARELGLKILPWTVDCEDTIAKVLDDGVDGVISNYPERVKAVAGRKGLSTMKRKRRNSMEPAEVLDPTARMRRCINTS